MAHAAIELYEALKEAGASDEKARTAAEAVEELRNEEHFHRIETRMVALEGRMEGMEHRMVILEDRMERIESRMDLIESRVGRLDDRLAKVEGDTKVIKWMMGFVLASNMAIFWLLIKMALAHGG